MPKRKAELRKSQTLRTQADVAAACGVSQRIVSTWERLPDFPKRGGYGWSKVEILKWYESRLEHHEKKAGAPGTLKEQKLANDNKLVLEKIGLAKLAAQTDALKLAELEGRMVSSDTVREWAREFCGIVAEAHRKLENRLATRIADPAVMRDVRAIIDRVKSEMVKKCGEKIGAKA